MIAVVGTGSVGRSSTAMFLGGGYDVVATDPAADPDVLKTFVSDAWPALRRLGLALTPAPPFDRLSFAASARDAARSADLVQENGPEDPELKAALIREIDDALPADRLIMSTSGGIPPSVLQSGCRDPERVLVAHPFNPPHLIPLVEIVGGEHTDPQALQWARGFFQKLGKRPIVLRREMTGHLGNRFQAALLREVFYCLSEDVASPQDIDDAVRYGLGLRWALMGGLMTFHLAGGPSGASHTLDMAADAYERWWADLGAPHLTAELRKTIIEATTSIEGDRPIQSWIRWRDEKLVDLMETMEISKGMH
jgi:carnitine 3-dehydrogenase